MIAGCVFNCSAFLSAREKTLDVGFVEFSENSGETMTESKELQLAELHTHAAYAHAAAAHAHSTGDHASGQELARKALDYSAKALKHTEDIAQSPPPIVRV